MNELDIYINTDQPQNNIEHKKYCKRLGTVYCAVLSLSVVSDSLRPARLLCLWGFSRQEYCSGLPCPLSGDLPNPGIKPRSPSLQVDSLPSEPPGKPKKWDPI